MNAAWRACLGGLLGMMALPALAVVDAEAPTTRDVQGADMQELRRYSDRLGRDWLRESLGLDLDALVIEFGKSSSFRSAPAAAAVPGGDGVPAAAGSTPKLRSQLSLRLEQTADLLRLQDDLRDIPFGLNVKGKLPLLDSLTLLETQLWLPFSWKDEIRAQARLPLLRKGTGGRLLTLRSDYSTQLGVNTLGTGLGTRLGPGATGLWAVDYDFEQRFGQGEDAAIHWLKFSRDF
jgi:hypothetical protein